MYVEVERAALLQGRLNTCGVGHDAGYLRCGDRDRGTVKNDTLACHTLFYFSLGKGMSGASQ